MSFSDLVHRIAGAITGESDKLLPEGLPSDTREAAALAEEAEKVTVTLDPELEPIFQAIGSLGNTIEGALAELGAHVGNLKATLAARAAAPVTGGPVPAAPGAAPVGVPDPAAPQPAAGPQPTINDLQRQVDETVIPPPVSEVPSAEATDPNPLEGGAPPTSEAPAPDASTSSPSTPSESTSTSPDPTPGTADPAGGNPIEPDVPAVPTPPPAAPEPAPAVEEQAPPPAS